MDFSKEYILMCEKADEIQKLAPKSKADLYFIRIAQKIRTLAKDEMQIEERFEYYDCDGFKYDRHYHSDNYKGKYWQKDSGNTTEYFEFERSNRQTLEITWLPRQDQLQSMYNDFSYTKMCNSDILRLLRFEKAKTWEQAWLMFIMSEKYKKIWDGENWIGLL